MDDRRLTLIVVPHGDLETRTFDVSYRRIKFLLVTSCLLIAAVAVVLALWFPIAAQAGRVNALEQDLERLYAERAQVAELARTLAEVEAQYEKVRQLLGADATGAGGDVPLLPPLRPEPSADSSRAEPTAQLRDAPVFRRGDGATVLGSVRQGLRETPSGAKL